jgi:hypothetical protein
MAKKSRSRKAAQPRHGARGRGASSPEAHEAARIVLSEVMREHKVEILSFNGEAELYLDGQCIAQDIPPIVRMRLETILAKIGAETRSFTVVIHNHSGLTRD